MSTTPDRPTDFSAADSAVGYLYQVRLALLAALQRLASDAGSGSGLDSCQDPTLFLPNGYVLAAAAGFCGALDRS
nr:hypothetical protein [Thiocapsa sp. KS1]